MKDVKVRQLYIRGDQGFRQTYIVIKTEWVGESRYVRMLPVSIYANDRFDFGIDAITISDISGFEYLHDADSNMSDKCTEFLKQYPGILDLKASKMSFDIGDTQETGLKYDSEKVRPSLLFRSLNKAVAGVLEVLEYGARKYTPDNWKKIEQSRYEDALARHYLAIMSGEQLDPESGLPHIDHLICSALFISEMQKQQDREQSFIKDILLLRDPKTGLEHPPRPKK